MDPEDQSKKYIRTLAGDIKIVEEGGTPDLAPLQSMPKGKSITAPPPTVPAPIKNPPPVLKPVPLPKLPYIIPVTSGKEQLRRPEESEPRSQASGLKEYIRTFAGDMKTVQEGGTPDLTPLTELPPAPEERPVVASPIIAPTPISSSNIGHVSSSPLSIPIVKIEPPIIPVLAQTPILPPPVPEPLSESPPRLAEEPKPIPLETYSGDFSDRMKETNAGTATVLAAEQDSAPQSLQVEDEPESSKNLIYSIAGAVLVIAGLGGAYFAYTHYYYVAAPVSVLTGIVQAPIFVDERQEISGTGVVLLQVIEQSVSRSLATHTVRFLFIASSTESIFSMLPLSAPDILRRNVNAVGSMAGVVNSGSSQSPFFILSVSTYRDTFAGMLSWERTMPNNLVELFPPYPVLEVATSSTTSTSSGQASSSQATTQKTASTTPAFIPGFRDEVVSNHDVRIYRDALGQSTIIYGYWNQTTLVIARDPAAFAEIIGRLATSHQ